MENHHFQWVNPLFQWPFSIAMLNYQRVSFVPFDYEFHSLFLMRRVFVVFCAFSVGHSRSKPGIFTAWITLAIFSHFGITVQGPAFLQGWMPFFSSMRSPGARNFQKLSRHVHHFFSVPEQGEHLMLFESV